MSINSNTHTIAFYNTENLFDVFTDNKTIEKDFSPTAVKNWTIKRYQDKINKLGFVISKIGFDTSNKPPVLIGLAEVENDAVLKDLTQSDDLKNINYGFVHINSPDERGIDVALLYDRDGFDVENAINIPIYIEDSSGKRDFTRDILLVTGFLFGDKVHVLVNHWPSRHEGSDKTDYKRIVASSHLTGLISSITLDDSNAQIILTSNFLDKGNGPYKFLKSDIFDEKFLTQHIGKYKGQPFRTYVGKKYQGGFSDHFPVFVQIQKF